MDEFLLLDDTAMFGYFPMQKLISETESKQSAI